ncbi:unnamed protein product, partial [marine sediment metagenome]
AFQQGREDTSPFRVTMITNVPNVGLTASTFINGSVFNQTIIRNYTIVGILNRMLKIGFDFPFGIFLLNRKIIECDCTPKIKTKAVKQFVTKLMPIGSTEYPSGETHITIFRKYGQHIPNPRSVLKAHKTLLRKCVSGGQNIIYNPNYNDELVDEDEAEMNPVKYTFKEGDLFPIPVMLDYVIRPRQKMINRFGFDDDNAWNEIVGVIKEKGKNAYFQPELVPSTNMFKWVRKTIQHKELSDFFINKNNDYIPDDNHFASWQRNNFDDSTEKELGQLENHHLWWKNENVILHVENQ